MGTERRISAIEWEMEKDGETERDIGRKKIEMGKQTRT